VILYRCFAWNERARPSSADGALWFPREFQGEGRHDNPDLYGCLYLADREVSCVVEQLARFRTQRLQPALLRRRGLPLALATIELDDGSEVIDLDEPRTLARERLRPSEVATRHRDVTQPQALGLHAAHARAAALRWWSTFESLWANYTVFDRGGGSLALRDVRALDLDDVAVREAADHLGLRI
jgi:RES domain